MPPFTVTVTDEKNVARQAFEDEVPDAGPGPDIRAESPLTT